MSRIKLVLSVAAVMAAMLVAFAGPAAADVIRFDNDGFRVHNNDGFRFDDNDNFFFVDGFRPFFFDDFFPFGGGGIGFDIDQEIGDTGDVTLNTTVS